ncbi:MAG: putative periplasmic protein [uncultured Sulfurovum sp.]|uniref:Putative periplasmic protein n=1 Tax=uncultured Sulfurovum sp. TaxID=269237 RepID=A0A6S6S5L3_9BACT|nr:MAG: putative periplasmic protein [uncultured Sulfurovum sp.]
MVISALFIALLWQMSGANAPLVQKGIILRELPPMDVSSEKSEAHFRLNTIRKSMKMNPLIINDKLALAAQAHANYLVENQNHSHYQTSGKKYFTGVKPKDRTIYANYESTMVSENLSTRSHSAKRSIEGLFSAIYHRFGFLNPSIDEIGVGVAQNKEETQQSAFVYVMGNSNLVDLCQKKSFNGFGKYIYNVCKKDEHRVDTGSYARANNIHKQYNPKIITYPFSNEKDVPTVFYEESPDPLPDYAVSGFPISVEFNDYFFDDVELDSFTLYNSNGSEITNVRLMDSQNDPNQRLSDKQFVLFPLERLNYNSRYRVEVEYSAKGQSTKLSWHFDTTVLHEKLHTITKNEETLSLTSKTSHILYFKPLHHKDILTNVQFPADLDVTFLDNNTLRVSINKNTNDFDILSNNKIVHVKVD